MHHRVDHLPLRPTAWHAALVGGGLVVLGAGMAVVRDGSVGAVERNVFRAVNDLPAPSARPSGRSCSWAPCSVRRSSRWSPCSPTDPASPSPRSSSASSSWSPSAWSRRPSAASARGRRSDPTSIATDSVPLTGESFVSGHAMLAAALAVVVTPYLVGRWRVLPALLAALVAVGRVYVGAHAPLDVLCGAAGGVAVGAVVDLLVRRRRPEVRRPWHEHRDPGTGPVGRHDRRPAPPPDRGTPAAPPPASARRAACSSPAPSIMAVWVVLFAVDRLGQRAHRAGRRRRAALRSPGCASTGR